VLHVVTLICCARTQPRAPAWSGFESLHGRNPTVVDRRSTASSERLHCLAAARWRIALILTFAMMAVYFGFILLVAFDKALLARTIVPGLSVGILLGACVIATAWILIAIYVGWANRHYDEAIAALRNGR
jgi:uncharacterized membrane protein (DUF485 family)